MMNWKGFGRKPLYYPVMRLMRLRKAMENLSQDSRSPGQDLNPKPPEYEAGLLTT
jgi:hypothetical protein